LKVIEERNRKIMEIIVFVQHYHHSSIISIIFGRKEITKVSNFINTKFPLILPPKLLKDLLKCGKETYLLEYFYLLYSRIAKKLLKIANNY
jgi:hypothetical protein